MSYPGTIALLVCSLGVVFSAFAFHYLNSVLSEKDRRGVPAWVFVVALILLGLALYSLHFQPVGSNQIFTALALTTCLLLGIFLKWSCETVAQKSWTLHEAVLAKSLLAAPLAAVLLGGVFTARYRLDAFLLWFLSGYFWHAVFSDFERLTTREKIVIRRREPPTLPHDFRRPEINPD